MDKRIIEIKNFVKGLPDEGLTVMRQVKTNQYNSLKNNSIDRSWVKQVINEIDKEIRHRKLNKLNKMP